MSKYIVMVFAGACSFGILSTFVKLAYGSGYTAAEIAFSQAAMGAVVLWALSLPTMRKHPFRLRPRDGAALLATGVCIGGTTFVYYLSVQYIAASLAIVLLMQFCWLGLLLDWLLFRQRPTRQQAQVALLVLSGTLLAAGVFGEQIRQVSLPGVLYALLSALLYALYVVANSRCGNNLHALQKSAVIMTGSAAGIFLINAPLLLASTNVDDGLLRWTLFLSFFGTIVPPVLFSKGIPRIGAGVSAIVMTAELPVAVLCSHIVLHEPIAPVQWLGVAVMLVAIAMLNRR